MTEYRLSPLAEQDIETILEWTHEEFGEKARIRYEALLTRAIMDVTYYPGNKEGHIPTRSASEGPMKSSQSRRGSPWDD